MNTSTHSLRRASHPATLLLLTTLAMRCLPAMADTTSYKLQSPNGQIKVSIRMPELGLHDTPQWSATFRGKPVLERCALNLMTAQAGNLLYDVHANAKAATFVNRQIKVLFGKSNSAENYYRELRL